MAEVVEIEVSLLRPSPYNPRIVQRPELMQALTESIRVMGVRQPLLVWAADGGYEVVDGGRRLAAARRLGLSRVPCIVMEGDLSSHRRTALSVHLTQDDLTPDELVCMIDRLVAEEEFRSVEEICRYYGLSKQWYYGLRKASRVAGVAPSTAVVVESSGLDESRKAELLRFLDGRGLPRSAVRDVVGVLEENPGLSVGDVVTSYLASMPRRLDDFTVEAEGLNTYQIRRVEGGVEFVVKRGGEVLSTAMIPACDIRVVRRLWWKA